ncbi:MAG: transporter [Bacteroidaceae bacterium]|nr:transporter [Bacteroidaceae bacterium]
MIQKLRTYALPIAMIAGFLAHDFAASIAFLTPYLLFAMLLVSYCKIDMHSLSIKPLYAWLLAIQFIGAWGVYFLLKMYDPIVAQGAFICLFCPTATSAPVVAAMLGGNLSLLVGYSLLCNLSVAIAAPLFFSLIGIHTELAFFDSVMIICKQVLPLLLLPLLLAALMQRYLPRLHMALRSRPSISFYLWVVALFIVVGKSLNFVMQQSLSSLQQEIVLAIVALLCCIVQFVLGRVLGARYGDKVSGAQGLGQKNTVLAIWMALTYLHPIASVAPASYVIWQNIINSSQIMLNNKKIKQ